MFLHVLEDYHKATKTNKNVCFAGCASWHNKILFGSSEYVSMLNLSQDLGELSLNEFKYEAFRNIGAIIEATLQPYLKELLLQIRIGRKKTNPNDRLETMKLGDVVNELYQLSGYTELFAPPPWGIRLSQWRNMAQHYNTRLEKDQIIGRYNVGDREHEVILTREDLFNSLKRIQSILSIVKGARSIFFVDNIKEIRPFLANKSLDVRTDIKVFHFASSLATQGFELKDISFDEMSTTVIIQDVTECPSDEPVIDYQRKRIIHSSQFIYVVWSYFSSEVITIKLFDKNNTLKSMSTGKGSDCEAVSNESIPIEELANRVVLTF